MDFGSINWLAVLLATVVSFISGFIWFGPKTFYPVWWKAMGKSPNSEPGSSQNMGVVFGSITVALFVQSLVFSIIFHLVLFAKVAMISDYERRRLFSIHHRISECQ